MLRTAARHLSRALAEVAIIPIRLYQRLLSPLLGPRCRYYPTCSSYAVTALRDYGVVRGTVLAAWRVVRCNPWSNGGIDHPHDQPLFRQPGSTVSRETVADHGSCAHDARNL